MSLSGCYLFQSYIPKEYELILDVTINIVDLKLWSPQIISVFFIIFSYIVFPIPYRSQKPT